VGAVVTLTSNLQSAITLARWVRQFLESWTAAIAQVWHYVLFFLPKLYTTDAVVLTIATFAIVNMIASLKRQVDETAGDRESGVALIVTASSFLWCVFLGGLGPALMGELRTMDEFRTGETGGYWWTTVTEFVDNFQPLLRALPRPVSLILVAVILLLAAFLFSLAIPLLPATVIYGVLRTTTPFRLSVAALSMRLWRVIAGICLLVALNYLSLWIGQQPWAPNWSR